MLRGVIMGVLVKPPSGLLPVRLVMMVLVCTAREILPGAVMMER